MQIITKSIVENYNVRTCKIKCFNHSPPPDEPYRDAILKLQIVINKYNK